MSHAMARAVGVLTPAAVLCAALAPALGLPRGAGALAFTAATALLAVVLGRAWSLARRGDELLSASELHWMKLHLLLHGAPLAFAYWTLFAPADATALPLWALAFAPFYLSGYLTWKALHARFGTLLYALFARGNAALGIMSLVLASTSQVVDSSVPPLLLGRLLALYVGVHFLVTAFAVQRIAHDFEPGAR